MFSPFHERVAAHLEFDIVADAEPRDLYGMLLGADPSETPFD